MNIKDLIIQELEATSEPLLNEILDFVRFLKIKQVRELQETHKDLEDSKQALSEAKEKGTISLEELKNELGL